MPVKDECILAFVWRPNEIKSSVIDAVRGAHCSLIYDFSDEKIESYAPKLIQADATGSDVGLKVDLATVQRPGALEAVIETEIRTLWVDLSAVSMRDAKSFLEEFTARSDFEIIPIIGDVEFCGFVAEACPGVRRIALKGCESAGFVGAETVFTLYSAVRELFRTREEAPGLIVWGGLATAEASAAFLSAGASGIVYESVHWLTSLVEIKPEAANKLKAIRPDHTDLVGLTIGRPARFFNKGNSQAVKKLKEFTESICGPDFTEEIERIFVQEIVAKKIHPLDGHFDRNELIPLGVEATFASSFVRDYGAETKIALNNFTKAISGRLVESSKKQSTFVTSSIAARMGVQYPFIQGAMSWITDNPAFARRVAEEGALPTLALGMMDEAALQDRLGNLAEVMGEYPYAVNVITLHENPFRTAQLSWIKQQKPAFAVIAAGEPSHAQELLEAGIETIYIAPTEELLKMAVEAGVKYIICEGNEAGGHVGKHTTVTLAQIVHEMRRTDPELLRNRHIILAGGVFNRETAFMAAMLGADAVQMGTIYLATQEIVDTGALSACYQKAVLQAAPGGTVVTGEASGLNVRSLKTTRMNAICSLERDFAAGTEDERSFRQKIEALSAGSLYVAAKAQDRATGAALTDAECMEKGQFMSGACAGSVSSQRSLRELHQQLAEGTLQEGLPFAGPLWAAQSKSGSDDAQYSVSLGRPRSEGGQERIAITGMSIVNALGNSPDEVWNAALAMKSGVIEVPLSKWDHSVFYHPRPRMPEKTYCKVGAFQNIDITRKDINVPPQDFRTMTDATKLTLWLAKNAVEESGILESEAPRERIAVLISQNSGEAAATLQDVIIRGCCDNIVSSVKRVIDLTPEMEKAVGDEVKSGRIAIDDTTLLGRLNCSAGGFICNKYGFMGPSFSVSAACATALVALYSAYQMIRNGIIDIAVVGGGEESLTPMHFLEFSALGALAGLSGVEREPREVSRPFDAGRDGMVLGEGGGVIVIERESVAKSRGAHIHAYITSMGASNNHLGMVESSRITQEIAVKASFRDANYGPEAVGVIECHATSTRQGDVEEAHALRKFYNGNKPTVLTSFKSQIGHTLGASGVNSLIRGVMALKGGIYPATLNFTTPDPDLEIESSTLRILPESADWVQKNGASRRLQVNAFGFGGSNYVVQLEEACENSKPARVGRPSLARAEQPLEAGAASVALPEGISLFNTTINGRSYRLAVVAETEDKALALVTKAEPLSSDGPLPVKRVAALARQGIHIGVDEAPQPLAFVFPGQGSHYAGMSHELYQTFPVIKEWMDKAAHTADFDILKLLFFDKEEDLQKTRWQQPALFTIEYAMARQLQAFGIRPSAMAGHSLGELTALCLAGVYSFGDGFRIVNKRAQCMDRACSLHADPGVMMAVDAPLDRLQEIMAGKPGLYITNYNSPRQLVVGGATEKVTRLGAELKENGFRNTLLRVSMAFHSPIMECIHDDLEAFIAEIEFHAPKIPVISNTTMRPFPNDPVEIKRIVMAHLESPVHWMENVAALHDQYGIRSFIEVGPREILSNLISDILEDASCIPTCLPSAEALMFKTALAQLYVRGNLGSNTSPRVVAFPRVAKSADTVSTRSVSLTTPIAAPVQRNSALENIIQRQINSFIVESFGRFLKPALLEAIRTEHDPNFSEQALDGLLHGMFPNVSSSPLPIVAPPVRPTAIATGAASIQHEQMVSAPIQEAGTQTASATAEDTQEEDTVETVIRIIMEATGYERDEIEPDMDLREDLSIRSSRLPVIMDSVEGHFGLKIELEDFMDVRTIRDISDRIAAVISRDKEKKSKESGKTNVAQTQAQSHREEEKQYLKRIVFREALAQSATMQPVEITPMDSVAVMCATPGVGLRKKIGEVIRRDYGAHILPMAFLEDLGSNSEGFDLRSDMGMAYAVEAIQSTDSLAGLVIIVDDSLESHVHSMEETASLLKGFFSVIKAFLESSAKKFVVLAHTTDGDAGHAGLLAEGVLGLFLSAAQEFSSVLFRTLRLDANTNVRDAIREALNRGHKTTELIVRRGEIFTKEGIASSALYHDADHFTLSGDDVVVFTGGCSGILPFLAKGLAPFGCKMVFIGRTQYDASKDTSAENAKSSALQKSNDIARTLRELDEQGIEAIYISADVSEWTDTEAAVKQILSRFGRITGVIHGAGVLRDNFIRQLSEQDFAVPVDVKFLGAWNIYKAAKDHGLRLFVGLSSAACIQGNPGQSNYAAGNRMMSALISKLATDDAGLRCKALMLPPIDGAGMAEDPDIKQLMKRMNAGYVHAVELAQLFCRELFVAPAKDIWVLFMRSLPDLSTVRLKPKPVHRPDEFQVEAVSFSRDEFPMIDAVSSVDLKSGEIVAKRAFALDNDFWISDHKPFKFLKHPLVSAIMALETFLEAAGITYPHLEILGARDAEFLNIIDCAPGVERNSQITGRLVSVDANELVYQVALDTWEVSPTGRSLNRTTPNYRAKVLMSGHKDAFLPDPPGLPVKPSEITTRPMDKNEVQQWYDDRTDMQDRYRIIESIEGTGSDGIRGAMVYRATTDHRAPKKTHYQYSPYTLEAMMQIVNFYVICRDPEERRSMIPVRIGEVLFTRKCLAGDRLFLEARMLSENEKRIIWNARAVDEKGSVIMTAREITMRWFSK